MFEYLIYCDQLEDLGFETALLRQIIVNKHRRPLHSIHPSCIGSNGDHTRVISSTEASGNGSGCGKSNSPSGGGRGKGLYSVGDGGLGSGCGDGGQWRQNFSL